MARGHEPQRPQASEGDGHRPTPQRPRASEGDGHRPTPQWPQASEGDGHRPTLDTPQARAAIQRDLECYAELWQSLVAMEIEAPYGPHDCQPADRAALEKQGSCVFGACLRPGTDGLEVTWGGDAGWDIDVGDTVLISRSSPTVDKLTTGTVADRAAGYLRIEQADVGDDIEAGEWRVDKEVNYVQFYRTSAAIEAFASLAPFMAPRRCKY